MKPRKHPAATGTPAGARFQADMLDWLDMERARHDDQPGRPELGDRLGKSRMVDDTAEDLMATIALVQRFLRDDFIVEECRANPSEGCVSCEALDLERRLDTLAQQISKWGLQG